MELTLEGDEEPSAATTEEELKREEAELPESEDATASSDQGKDSWGCKNMFMGGVLDAVIDPNKEHFEIQVLHLFSSCFSGNQGSRCVLLERF